MVTRLLTAIDTGMTCEPVVTHGGSMLQSELMKKQV
jgi:hypothetical protein